MRAMRAFTLAEVMIVVVIIGVSAAVAVPNILRMVKAAEGEQALRENAAAVAAARDNARGQGACLDYILRDARTAPPGAYPAPAPPPPTGPYVIDIWGVPCPGETLFPPTLGFTRVVSEVITQLSGRTLLNGVPTGPLLDRVHFHRDGSIYDPIAVIQIDAVVNNAPRRFRVYPAAGTIEIDDAK